MRSIYQHLVPWKLKPEQKETWMSISGDFINMADKDNKYLNNSHRGWNMAFFVWSTNKTENSEYKPSSSLWSKKFQVNRDKGKVALEVFFDCQGTVHCEFIPEGKTVNKEMYTDILHHLRDMVRKKCPKNWEPTVGVSFMTTVHHTDRFWSRIS